MGLMDRFDRDASAVDRWWLATLAWSSRLTICFVKIRYLESLLRSLTDEYVKNLDD
jgi:hypothetical protein